MLNAGQKLGPYEILSSLGAGGMGEVYRARDTRLERDVAVKVLPSALSSDANLKQRLEREAKSVSRLSHPHICTLHDIGHHDGLDFLVMELVEGETLEQRLLRGPLPPEQALRLSTQLADALARAHKLGITHRDLKPGNIMLTKSGAKLMDFGLARQSEVAPLAQALTEMTAEQAKLTSEGMLVGTFQYMAPEQLEGKEADARADIFALGEVIYEMATGKPAFSGKSRASLIASILTSDPPPIAQLQPLAPLALERVVRKCLAKDPDDRWQSAADLAAELRWIAESSSQAAASPGTIETRKRHKLWAWSLAGTALCLVAALATLYFRQLDHQAPVIRSVITPEEGTSPILTGDFAGPAVLSPDGKAFAFTAARERGAILLFVRPLNSLHARVLAGTEGATFPFWSADSRSLGFFAGGKLKTVLAEGGMPTDICPASIGRGGAWNADGTIIFSPDFQSPIYQVPAAGGTPKPVTVIDVSRHDSHRWPYFLPDGKHFLYLAVIHKTSQDPNDEIYIASLDGKENRVVMRGNTNAAYAAGRLLFMRNTSLMAQAFDPVRGVLHGAPERVAEDVLSDATIWRAQFDVSGAGLLIYSAGGLMPWQAMWFDRAGKPLGPAGEKVFNLLSVRLSPDGTRLATEAGEDNNEIWIYDQQRRVNTRLTFGNGGASSSPVWSPDGRWIVYTGVRTKSGLYRKPVNGTGQEELLLGGVGDARNPLDWSPDGKYLMFGIGDLSAKGQIWLLPLAGDRKPVPLTDEHVLISSARFSPDGHWIAYSSNESGRQEIYVMPFERTAGKWQVSSAGGVQPIWRRDGKELLYWSAENILMSVPITLLPGEVKVGPASPLFRLNNPVGFIGIVSPYDISLDGQRLVLITTPEQTVRPFILVANWTSDSKQ